MTCFITMICYHQVSILMYLYWKNSLKFVIFPTKFKIISSLTFCPSIHCFNTIVNNITVCCCVQAKSNSWLPMQQTWGANWALRPGFALQPPFSFRLSTLSTGKTVTATNVVPQNWQAGATYSSLVNFD